jgi:hypothetical protein
VLAEERRGHQPPTGQWHLVEVVDLDDGEAGVPQVQRDRRVGQVAPRGLRHHHRVHPRAQHHQRLQHDVVLVPVRDDHVVDVVRQVVQGVPVAVPVVGADERVGDDARLRRLQDEAGVPEVADPAAALDVPVGRQARRRCEQPVQLHRLRVVQLERLAQLRRRRRPGARPEVLVEARVREAVREVDDVRARQPRGAQDERALDAGVEGQLHRLTAYVVHRAVVHQRLDVVHRRLVAGVVGQLHEPVQGSRQLGIERAEVEAGRALPQELLGVGDRGREVQHVGPVALDDVEELGDLGAALLFDVDEVSAPQLRVDAGRHMHLRRMQI